MIREGAEGECGRGDLRWVRLGTSPMWLFITGVALPVDGGALVKIG
jgi:hypothetical protein